MVPLADSGPLALSFLFQRLKWPVPMSRWRTAREIRNLLNHPDTRPSTTDALFDFLGQCQTEAEICEILTIVFLTLPNARPERASLVSRVHCPSILADIILERIYGEGRGIGGWRQAHSGRAPTDFEGGSYFEKHKTSHVPPIFLSNLMRLEHFSGYPFVQHWAYEWKALCDKLGTQYTRYLHYFDDVSESHAGIIGQYWQRMHEVFLSAYLRTLAYAVSEWRLPQSIAEGYSFDIVHGIAGLFDVEPSVRPSWLSDYPEKSCAASEDFMPLIHDLVQASRAEGMRLVSLDTPVASSVQKYAKLTLSAHLVTPDYEFPDEADLYEKMALLSVTDTFELKGSPVKLTIDEVCTAGKNGGDEVAVCGSLFPIPFGCWQSDYLSIGLMIPASYTTGETEIRCTSESIDLVAPGGACISRTQLWNDRWEPQYPNGGATRCGVATMIDEEVLGSAQELFGRNLAWFAKLRIWDREKEYGDYSASHRTAFVLD